MSARPEARRGERRPSQGHARRSCARSPGRRGPAPGRACGASFSSRRCRSPSRSAAATCGRPAAATSRPRTPTSSRIAISVMPQVSGQIAQVASSRTSRSSAGRRSSPSTTPPIATPSRRAEAGSTPPASMSRSLKAAYAQARLRGGTAHDALVTAQTQDDRQQTLRKSGVVSQSVADDSALRAAAGARHARQGRERRAVAKAALAGDPTSRPTSTRRAAGARGAARRRARPRPHDDRSPPADGVISQTDRLQDGQYVTPAIAGHEPGRHRPAAGSRPTSRRPTSTHMRAGPAGRGHASTPIRRPRLQGEVALDRRRHRLGIRPAAGAERHRQLGQGRAARARARRARRPARTCRRCAPA